MSLTEYLLAMLVVLQALLLLELLRFRRLFIPVGSTFFEVASAIATYMSLRIAMEESSKGIKTLEEILRRAKEAAQATKEADNVKPN